MAPGNGPGRVDDADAGGDWHLWFPRWPAVAGPVGRDTPESFAAGLADLVHTLQQEGINDDLHALTMIAQGAVGMIMGAQQGGIVVPAGPRRLDSRAGVGELAPLVLKLQNQVGEGPCLDAVTQATQIVVTDLYDDGRWPGFASSIAPWNLRSVLCTPMRVQQSTVGSLTLLSTEPNAFDDAAARLAAVFAAHATLALTSVQQIHHLRRMVESREVIGRAEGMLMQRHRVTADAAFGMLVRASQRSNMKLRDVSRLLAETGHLPAPSVGPRSPGRDRPPHGPTST